MANHPGLSGAASAVRRELRDAAEARRRVASGFLPARTGPGAEPPPSLAEDHLRVFVPIRLVNPLNAREHAMARYRRQQRESDATAAMLHAALSIAGWQITVPPERPKAITFRGYLPRRFDSDGYVASFKGVRDALQGVLIHHDGVGSGHTFTYLEPVVGRLCGAEVTVRLVAP